MDEPPSFRTFFLSKKNVALWQFFNSALMNSHTSSINFLEWLLLYWCDTKLFPCIASAVFRSLPVSSIIHPRRYSCIATSVLHRIWPWTDGRKRIATLDVSFQTSSICREPAMNNIYTTTADYLFRHFRDDLTVCALAEKRREKNAVQSRRGVALVLPQNGEWTMLDS